MARVRSIHKTVRGGPLHRRCARRGSREAHAAREGAAAAAPRVRAAARRRANVGSKRYAENRVFNGCGAAPALWATRAVALWRATEAVALPWARRGGAPPPSRLEQAVEWLLAIEVDPAWRVLGVAASASTVNVIMMTK